MDACQTVADGIAVKRPGALTLPLIERHVDRIVVVSEDEVGDAMALLLGEAKLVVEGAGAVGVAALLSGREDPAGAGVTAIALRRQYRRGVAGGSPAGARRSGAGD